jgi:hypothetical protein
VLRIIYIALRKEHESDATKDLDLAQKKGVSPDNLHFGSWERRRKIDGCPASEALPAVAKAMARQAPDGTK